MEQQQLQSEPETTGAPPLPRLLETPVAEESLPSTAVKHVADSHGVALARIKARTRANSRKTQGVSLLITLCLLLTLLRYDWQSFHSLADSLFLLLSATVSAL